MDQFASSLLTYLTAHPEVSTALATLIGSFGVALSRIGGERFATFRSLYRLLTTGTVDKPVAPQDGATSTKTLIAILFVFALSTILSSPAFAVMSVDFCNRACDSHQLQWRATQSDAWADVASPFPLEDVTLPKDVVNPLTGATIPAGSVVKGVLWDGKGISSFGEFRAKAMRADQPDSPYSTPVFIDEPPVAPLVIASLGVVVILRARIGRDEG